MEEGRGPWDCWLSGNSSGLVFVIESGMFSRGVALWYVCRLGFSGEGGERTALEGQDQAAAVSLTLKTAFSSMLCLQDSNRATRRQQSTSSCLIQTLGLWMLKMLVLDQRLDRPIVQPLRNLQGISGMVWSL